MSAAGTGWPSLAFHAKRLVLHSHLQLVSARSVVALSGSVLMAASPG